MIYETHKHAVTVGGHRIHALLQSTFEVRLARLLSFLGTLEDVVTFWLARCNLVLDCAPWLGP